MSIAFPGNPLTSYNKGYADIIDVMISLKEYDDQPNDTYLVKYYKDGQGNGAESGGVLIDEPSNTFTLNKTETDIIPVNVQGYRIYLGVMVAGLNNLLWLRTNENERVFVEQDGINVG